MAAVHESFYESNLHLLEKNHPHIWEMMTKACPEPVGEVLIAPNGKKYIKAINKEGNSIPLHDPNDPEREVAEFLEMIPENSTGVVALIGMGLGYTPLAILKQRPDIRHLAIFDLEPGIFRQALQHMDLTDILSDPRTILCISKEQDISETLAPATKALKLENIHTLKHLFLFSYDREAYEEFSQKIFSIFNEHNVGGSTSLVLGDMFLSNRIKQFSSIHHNKLLESLHNKMSDTPAILVAGGPSLDKNIHLLSEAKGKAVIIAVDSVLPALVANGITPDFITAIDPEEFAYETYAEVTHAMKDVSMVCMPWISPTVPKTFPGKEVFWCFTASPMDQWLNKALGGELLTGGAQTVAHLNLLTAIIMGCSPIVFIGQDLAYTGFKDHASHTSLTTKSMMDAILESPKELYWVEGNCEEKVPTMRGFLSMKKWFETMITDCPGDYINATEGGARIKGTEIMPLQEVLERYCLKHHRLTEIIESSSDTLDISNPKPFIDSFRSVQKEITTLQKDIKKLKTIQKPTIKQVRNLISTGKNYSSFDALPKDIQSKLLKIDVLNNKMDNATMIWQLVEEITLEGLRQSERLKHEILRLESEPKKYMQYLLKSLERLQQVRDVRHEVLTLVGKLISDVLKHHKKEKQLIKSTKQKNGKPEKAILKLAQFYYDSGEITQASPLFEQLATQMPDSAEVHFYLGCIASHFCKYQEGENYFSRARDLSQEIGDRINEHLKQQGDKYLGYAIRLQQEHHDIRNMLLKGLRYCKDHKTLAEQFPGMLETDLNKAEPQINSNSFQDAEPTIQGWVNDFNNNPWLSSVLPPDKIARLFKYSGQILFASGNMTGAIDDFMKALGQTPEDTAIHFSLTECFFSIEKFPEGIEHLEKAVELDRAYGKHWENIGDNLLQAGLHEDAIAAYEKCFLALPENTFLLKKIGDCYLAVGMEDAAHEAYKHVSQHLSG